MFTDSRASVSLRGVPVPGAQDRQKKIPGFEQDVYSKSHILTIGAGGIISHIAPTLVRKGIGAITLLDDDIVEASNLNRQRFYAEDIGRNKAVCLAQNLVRECIYATQIVGVPMRLESAIENHVKLDCDVVICGVDNNPARVAASRFFRAKRIPVIFSGVSMAGDHGYVFVQDTAGPCVTCLYPDIENDDRFPCPGTPAIADILQAVGALAVYAVDSLVTSRARLWNCRRIHLADGTVDGSVQISTRDTCKLCGVER